MKFSIKYSFPLISSIFLTIIPLIFSSALTVAVITHEQIVLDFSWQDWVWATLICCITCTFAFTPPTLLALIFGYFIGWQAVLPVFLMNMVAIFLVNAVTKRIDGDKFRAYLSENKKVNAILENIRKEELKFIFFTKLSPILPFALTNFVFALSGAKLKNILIGGFFGMIPRTLLAVWTGSQAKEIRRLLENPNEGNLQKILIIILVIVSVGGVMYYVLPKKSS
ncbi:SNARE associated protein [Emticicia oligotrophica DSM 17448]|uniref:TVP38/TMEM64 family membrane protein n=1 Tax=Emticicia oligotrophica (strain DSM 17448 / CIP 109782 / MTCC 6937 / GPTSA100-15) TaxID=929562 RepID=A0ABM5MZG6_EMTOG|nr:VTT domain-containing protein [Emticicia oligotrophica]AFK02587.1 SNARE associated protein [Emticicia oligotrophica DSM 17448]